MKFCGPKLSICCTMLSVWAVIQLVLMGVFFYIRSVALIEDLSIPVEAEHDAEHYLKAMEDSYDQIGTNCFIAAAMYGVTFIVSGWQMWLNLRA